MSYRKAFFDYLYMDTISEITADLLDIKRDICLWMAKKYKEPLLEFFVDNFSAKTEIINRIPDAKNIIILLKWSDVIQNHTNRMIWMLSESVKFTELRRYYYDICDYYGSDVGSCCVEFLLEFTNKSITRISINIPTGIVSVFRNGTHNSENIVFDNLDISKYIVNENINLQELERMIEGL